MPYSEQLHQEKDFETVKMEDFDFQGISEDDYHGQDIWDGEKLVTQEEWDAQQAEEKRLALMRGEMV